VLSRVVPLTTTARVPGGAAAAFLAQPDLAASTRRSYQQTLGRLERELGADQPLATLTADQVTAAVTAAWADRAPATWNRHLATVRSFFGFAGAAAGWSATSPSTWSAGPSRSTAPRPFPWLSWSGCGAEALFREASGGWTLHQLRHSALTHLAEQNVRLPLLMAKSQHASLRSLQRYARQALKPLRRSPRPPTPPAGAADLDWQAFSARLAKQASETNRAASSFSLRLAEITVATSRAPPRSCGAIPRPLHQARKVPTWSGKSPRWSSGLRSSRRMRPTRSAARDGSPTR
jgi:hypothetical protein